MRFKKTAALLLALCTLTLSASAAECVGNAPCSLSAEDFGTNNGIFLSEVPGESLGTLCYGTRTLRSGDVIPTEGLDNLQFVPNGAQEGAACVGYFPIYGDRLGDKTVLTISLRSGKNQPPEARDSSLETYKNLSLEGTLDVTDADGDTLTYQVVKTPKRGTLQIREDGSFLYTPKKNKVGTDSFTFTATDAAGGVSGEATVTIEILKPTDKETYADMEGRDGEFEAMWLRSTGLLEGSTVSGRLCFSPQQTVSRGEYLVMLMEMAGIAPEEVTQTGFADEDAMSPWMKSYVCGALRSGLVRGMRVDGALCFCPDSPITRAQAAVMAQNILKEDAVSVASVTVPTWAKGGAAVLSRAGITGDAESPLTRLEGAKLLYQVSKSLPKE